MTPPEGPEQLARREIDRLLAAVGWAVQDFKAANLTTARGLAICELVLAATTALLDIQLDHQC